MERLRLALVQIRSSVGTETFDPRDDNLERALLALRRAADEGAQLAVFGELYLCGYRTDEHLWRYATAVDPPDAHLRALERAARELGLHLVIGVATFGRFVPGDVYNSALLVGPQGLLGVYRKTHVASFCGRGGIAREGSFYSPGRELPVFETPLGRLGIHICNDVNFPEPSRVQALKGADILINCSASAAGFEQQWEHLLFARAVENASWYAVCSVVGEQRGDRLFGGSRVVSPFGDVVAMGALNEEDFVVAEIDPALAWRARAAYHTFNARHPELYGPIAEPVPHP
jgi:predicted amidohydrolase